MLRPFKEERILFQQIVLGQLDIQIQKKKNFLISQYIKKNLKWIKGLYIKAKIIKPLEGNMVSLQDFGFGNGFLHMISKPQAKKLKN